MFERVTYADLQFVGGPLEKSRGEELDEGELTYENIHGSRAQEEPPRSGQGAEGWRPWTRWVALGVLGIGLFLLSIIVSLGVQYAQATWQLQQASQDHAAKLNSTVVALWHSWAAKNRTQQQLQQQELLVDQANHSLALLWRERVSLMANLSQASSCQQIGCCSPGWKLFRWKCLRISDRPKNWEDSQQDCKGTSSHLLILKASWDAHDVWPPASPERSNRYWIGLKKSRSSFFWVDQTPDIGIFVGGSRYKQDCVELHEGALNFGPCSEGKKFICEKPARPWP